LIHFFILSRPPIPKWGLKKIRAFSPNISTKYHGEKEISASKMNKYSGISTKYPVEKYFVAGGKKKYRGIF